VPTPPPAATLTELSSSSRRHAQRRFLLAAAAAALADLPALALAASPAVNAARPDDIERTFTAFCDTLVPADELTPAASALGVPAAILGDVRGHALAERLLQAGCAWLDEASGGFAAASEAARVAVCERMQAMPWESPAGRFFHLMRNSVMAEYYAAPASWRGLALDRPPQPLGFFDAVR